MYKKKEHIHFVGIGGIGMSGIAKILRLQGYIISGCDMALNKSILELQSLGCVIAEGNNQDICKNKNINIVVYSSDIKHDNPELVNANKLGITIVHRSIMLAEILQKKFSIAVTGSHGKTTTTSLISHILIESGIDPTVVSGGILKKYNTQAIMGKSDFAVAEADESDRSFLNLPVSIGVITNISLEHLETYKNLDDIKNTFKKFLDKISFYGKAIVCIDDINIKSIIQNSSTKIITYGFSKKADLTAKNIKLFPECSTYEIWYKNKFLSSAQLNIAGKHNVLNSLASIAVGLELEISLEKIINCINSFDGVERRFQYHGKFKGADVFDDYGHHPNEIEQTLEVAKRKCSGKLFVIFQPHRYTRTFGLWQEFINVFKNSKIDSLVITDIFAKSEAPIEGVTGKELAQAIKNANDNIHTKYLPIDEDFCSIVEHLNSEVNAGDLILFLGAGKLDKAAELISKNSRPIHPNKANNQLNY